MNLDRLHTILNQCSMQLRKGEEIVEEPATDERPIRVTHIYAMPHESEALPTVEKVDLHFVVIGVNKEEAEKHRDELAAILADYPDKQELASGPSYIAVGARIGDQGAAFQLFAVGQVLGFWKVITPKMLGMEGAFADQAAGSGYIMISGFHPEQKAA